MPKLNSFINLATTGKVAIGITAGSIATMTVEHYTGSSEFSEDQQRAQMREEQQKKISIEFQQRSEELEKRAQDLEMLEKKITQQQADLEDKQAAFQRMQQERTETQGVAQGVVAVETVQQVEQPEEPADKQPEEPKADVVPTNNAPKRPAVFDGSGNKEKPVETTNENDASKPSVAFGSSGDVVVIEKGGAVSNAETERLRERERALSETLRKRNVESKATQTDDRLFEASTGGDDSFDGPSNPGMRWNGADQLKESKEAEVFISGSPKKPDTGGIRNGITNTTTSTISPKNPNVSSGKGGETIPARKADTEKPISTMNQDSASAKNPTKVETEPVIITSGETPKAPAYPGTVPVGSSSGGVPPAIPYTGSVPGAGPTPPPMAPGGSAPASLETFTQKLNDTFRPALEKLGKELKEKAEKDREIAKEKDLLKNLANWHPIAMAYKYIDVLNRDDEAIKRNEEREKNGEKEREKTEDRINLKQKTCIALDKCAKDFSKSSSVYGFQDCMMRLLLMFVTWNEVNEKTVMEIFQERLSSYWLDAFTYFVTTPEDELSRVYETYKQEMIGRIKQDNDKGYYCSGFPKGTADYYPSYEECRDNCVDFVVFNKEKNRIFTDSMYAEVLYQYVSRCDDVATCNKTNLVALRDDYIKRLAKLLLQNASGNLNDPAYRKTLLESVIKEVTSKCIAGSLTEDEKKHKSKEIRFLIRINEASLFKGAAEEKDLGTKEGNIRFIKIVEIALSGMKKKVSKTEGSDWLLHLDADLFSFFGIDATSEPRIPPTRIWFSDKDIKKTLSNLEKKMADKKDADLGNLKKMVGIFFWQTVKKFINYNITPIEFSNKLNAALLNSDSIVDRKKLKKELGNVKEADLKTVLPELLDHWNALVKGFADKASFLGMTTTKKDKGGNAVQTTAPMTPSYFKKTMSDTADILKLKTYSDLAEKERKAYANVKLFPIASKLRQSVIESRDEKSDTLTVKFVDNNELLCMREASSTCKGLLKLVLSYSKAEKLVLEGPWIHEFLASCPKDNVKSLTLKGGSFGIGCLGKISTPIDGVTFEGMNLKTLKALGQFFYMEKGNSLTLKNVDCREDYYEGEPGAIRDIRDNGATVQIEGCLWYKTGVRPIGSGAAGATAGGDPATTTGATPKAASAGAGPIASTTTGSAINPFKAQMKTFNYTPTKGAGPNPSATTPTTAGAGSGSSTTKATGAGAGSGSSTNTTEDAGADPNLDPSTNPFLKMQRKKFKKYDPNMSAGPNPSTNTNPFGKSNLKSPGSAGAGSSSSTNNPTTTGADPNDRFALFDGTKKKYSNAPGKKTTDGSPFTLPTLKGKGETAKKEDETEKDPIAEAKRRLKPRPPMHEGMLNEKDKKDLKQEFEGSGDRSGNNFETLLLERLRQKWNGVPDGEPIPVDVPYCRNHLKEVIKAAVDFAKTRGTEPKITLSGDFKDDTAALESTAMVDVVEELKDVKKIRTDMKSENGANIAFQSQLLETMSNLKKNGKPVRTEEIEVSGWDASSGDSEKVLEAVGNLGLKKFEVSNMHEDVLRNSNFSTSCNKKGWENLLNNTENVSFKNQKMDATSLGGLLKAVKSVKKKGGKMPNIELPTPPARKPGATKKTYEEILTNAILREIATP